MTERQTITDDLAGDIEALKDAIARRDWGDVESIIPALADVLTGLRLLPGVYREVARRDERRAEEYRNNEWHVAASGAKGAALAMYQAAAMIDVPAGVWPVPIKEG